MRNSIIIDGVCVRKAFKGETGGRIILEVPSSMTGEALTAWKKRNEADLKAAKAELLADGDASADEGDRFGRV